LSLILTLRVIGWNWIKGYVEQQVAQATGRDFTIAGDLDIDLSLNPLIRAEDIRLDNAPWGQFPNMAEIGALRLRIDLIELIKGRVVIPELGIREPVAHLAVSAGGKPNWRLGSETSKTGGSLPVVHRLVIDNGAVTYRDYSSGADLRLHIARIEGYTDDARDEFALGGSGRLGQQPWRMELRAGSLQALKSANAPYPVDLALALADTRANVEGTLTKPLRLLGADLNVSVESLNLSMLSPFFDGARPRLPRHKIEGRLTHTDDVWRLKSLQATVGESSLQGELAFDTRGERPRIEADLTSSLLRYDDFANLAPPSKKPQPLDLSALNAVDAIVNIRGDEILTPAVALRDARIDASLDDGRLRIGPFVFDAGGGKVRVHAVVDASTQPFDAYFQANIQQVHLNKVGDRAAAIKGLEGTVNGRIAARARFATQTQMADTARAGVWSFLDGLVIDDSRISYRVPDRDTQLQISADSKTAGKEQQLEIKGDGTWRGEEFALAFRSDPLLKLAFAPTNRPFAIAGRASVADAQVRVDGTLEQPLALQGIDLAVSMSGSSTVGLATALKRPVPDIPRYRLAGQLAHQGTRWKFDDLEAQVGESNLAGVLTVDTAAKRPYVKADLVSRSLATSDFADFLKAPDDPQARAWPSKARAANQAQSPLNLKVLRSLDADVRFAAEKIIAPNLPVEALTVDIALHDGRLRVEPFRVGLSSGAVRGKLVLDSTTPARGSLTVDLGQVDLQAIMEPFDLATSPGILGGHAQVSFIGATSGQIAVVEQSLLSTIYSFSIRDTYFTYRDPRSRTDIELTLDTTATEDGNEPIRVQGDGRYQGEPFNLSISAGSPLRLLDKEQVYPVDASIEVASTKAQLEGNIAQPLKLKGLNLRLSLKGPNPNQLQDFIGLPLPSLPPYEVEGALARDGGIWRYEDFQGTTGDTDLAGDISVHTLKEPRPLLVAELVSRTLDLDDLAGLIGAPPDPDETVSPEQKKQAETQASASTVLPGDPVDLSALRAIDARVSYLGKTVLTPLPIDDLRILAKLEDGRLLLEPLNFGVGGGEITSRLMLDSGKQPVRAEADTEIRRVDLEEILRRYDIADASVGHIGGRAHLEGTGASVADLLATLDGQLSLIMAGGRMDSLLIELAGLDMSGSIAALVGGDKAVPIRCAFTDFQSRDGQVDVETFVVDTTDTRFSGDGSINLDEETVNAVLVPHPKDWSLFAFPTPLYIKGRFSDLEIYPEYSKLLEQTATAVVLGLVATPFAALIPFVETGAGKNSVCQVLLDESRNQRFLKQKKRSRANRPDDDDSREPRLDFEELIRSPVAPAA